MSQESRENVLNMAAQVLQYRQRSAAALYDRLLEKGAASEDAEYAVARLKELGYLRDEEYASLIVRDLCTRGYGERRIRQALHQKKVEPDAADYALKAYMPDRDKLWKYIESKLKDEPAPDRKTLKKLTDGLCRRGFSWEEIRSALREYLDSEAMDNLED